MTSFLKHQLSFYLIVISFTISAQDVLFKTSVKRELTQSEKFLPIIHDDQSTTLFWLNDYEIAQFDFDPQFQLIDDKVFKKKDLPYRNLLGYGLSDQAYHLYFSNSSIDQFYVWTIYSAPSSLKGGILEIPLEKKEKLLDATSHQGHFYLLTIKRQTSELILYDYQGTELLSRSVIDFSTHKFGKDPKFPDLYSAIAEDGAISIPKVDSESPIAIELAARPAKLYHIENKLYLTLDHDPIKTILIAIDLIEGTGSHKIIRHQIQGCTNVNSITSNSFLKNNDFYQIQVCDQAMSIQARTLVPAKALTSLSVSKNEQIPFMNTPVRQEGSKSLYGVGTEKELVKTKQILKKIADGKAGISAYSQKDQVILTVGGFATSNSLFLFGPVSTLRVSRYNPLMYSLTQFGLSRTISFKSLLDGTNYQYQTGKISENVFEKIYAFEENAGRLKHKTLFRKGKVFVFGYYDTSDRTYYLRKFSED